MVPQSNGNNYYLVLAYLTYLALSFAATVWVARTLQKNGVAFLKDTFLGKDHLAESVNHLLVVGFYLINIGYVAMETKDSRPVDNFQQVLELMTAKLGVVLLVLGGMHFFNLYVFNRIRRAGELRHAERPVMAQGFTEVVNAASPVGAR